MDCKFHTTQLTSQVNNIFATLDQTNPKHTVMEWTFQA